MTVSVKQVLINARNLISDPCTWTQCSFAIDRRGVDVGINDSGACCFCAEGAVRKYAKAFALRKACLDKVESYINDSLWSFNDKHSHAEVIRLFDRAIAECDD